LAAREVKEGKRRGFLLVFFLLRLRVSTGVTTRKSRFAAADARNVAGAAEAKERGQRRLLTTFFFYWIKKGLSKR
jgi:hypothetical protein